MGRESDGRGIDVPHLPLHGFGHGQLELCSRRVVPAMHEPLESQRTTSFLTHHRRRSDEITARLRSAMTLPPDRWRLLSFQTVSEHLRQVANAADAVLDNTGPLTRRLRIDTRTPPSR